MKKSIFILAAVVAVAFSSCKKDHTCTCTMVTKATSFIPSTSTSASTTIKDTKSKAKTACEKLNVTADAYTTTCKLDN